MEIEEYLQLDEYGREFDLKTVRIEDYDNIKKYFMLRRPESSDSNILDLYLWRDCYPTWYFTTDKGLIFVARDKEDGTYYSSVPCCRNENLQECFDAAEKFFNEVLNRKLKMEVFDEEAVGLLNLPEDKYNVTRQREFDDYVYDAEKMRTLSGRKYHKKKNHLNAFKKEYEGRYEFRMLDKSYKKDILKFLDSWIKNKKDTEQEEYIEYEAKGIEQILDNSNIIEFKMGGVFIDGNLEAFTIGNYVEKEDMAYIPVEKANASFRGLYTFIASEFLRQAFPNAAKVNREDDMGLEGLRKSKMSYNPIYMVKKYNIIQK